MSFSDWNEFWDLKLKLFKTRCTSDPFQWNLCIECKFIH